MEAAVVEKCFCYKEDMQLTVLKTSIFFSGDGFTVYDLSGGVVFRVDNYGPEAKDRDEVVLMDASGKCLLTVRRKRPSLHHRWEGFLGEKTDGQKPIFSVKRSSIIGSSTMGSSVMGSSGVTVEMYNENPSEYHIEGSFSHRCCTIYDSSSRDPMAEIKRKVTVTSNVMLGKEVFSLCLKPGFDSAFAMGLVLVLNQIYAGEEEETDETTTDLLLESPDATISSPDDTTTDLLLESPHATISSPS